MNDPEKSLALVLSFPTHVETEHAKVSEPLPPEIYQRLQADLDRDDAMVRPVGGCTLRVLMRQSTCTPQETPSPSAYI